MTAAGPGLEAAPGAAPSLDARVRVELPGFAVDVALRAAAGEVLALLGPNGAGKTTVLRALAGIVPASGHVVLDGEPLHHLPVERRPLGMVFQDYLLFPHLSALDNVAFGPRCRGAGRGRARTIAAGWLDRVGLAGFQHLRPGALSGGQAQRVALARALASGPRLLLLDEPLAALDARTRLTVRAELRRHLADFTGVAVLVTHDPLDALSLADRLVVVEDGAVVQTGPPAAVARHPRSDYVARLVGLNLYRGTGRGGRVTVTGTADAGGGPVRAGGGPVRAGELELSTHERVCGPAFVTFRPAAVALYLSRPEGSPRNVWPARIAGIERYGDQVRVHLEGPVAAAADITPTALAELGLAEGRMVWAGVKAAETHAYPA